MKEKIHSMNHMFAYIQKNFPAVRVQQMREMQQRQEELKDENQSEIIMTLKGKSTSLIKLKEVMSNQENWSVEWINEKTEMKLKKMRK